ncbi:hypothetical protein BJ170DRAFT_608968 [Xylariales sp. AK1849]|nr:hypothetical protein BJ170DRAFT_608968 [Xylariales sp. AK1849]
MFEDFTFDQEVDSGTIPNTEPDTSLKDIPTDWVPSEAPPATALGSTLNFNHQTNSETIDGLIHQMSRQTLIPTVPDGDHYEAPMLEKKSAVERAQSIQKGLSLIPHDSSQDAIAPTPADNVRDLQQAQTMDVLDISVSNYPTNVIGPGTSRRITRLDTRLNSNVSHPCAQHEDPLQIIIAHEVQYNVQTSPPTTPISASQPSFSCITPLLGPDDTPDEPMSDSSLPLEIDTGYDEQDDRALLKGCVSLRQAGTPGGVRRCNGLRYCSSVDAALKSKNLRRNKVKMRKRERQKHAPTPPPDTISF